MLKSDASTSLLVYCCRLMRGAVDKMPLLRHHQRRVSRVPETVLVMVAMPLVLQVARVCGAFHGSCSRSNSIAAASTGSDATVEQCAAFLREPMPLALVCKPSRHLVDAEACK